MAKKSAADAALAWAAKAYKLHDALIVDHVQVHDPDSGEKLHSFRLVSAAQGNGPSHQVFIDAGGSVVDGTAKHEALFSAAHAAPPSVAPAMAPAPPITIAPDTNVLVLNPTDTLDETLIVTVPKNAGPAKADVYFVADTTASMGSILQAVKNGANNVLATLGGLGADLVFGVGNYKDFRSGDPFCFQHQVSPTNVVATVTASINTWAATGGGICPAASGQAAAITEASATAKLVAEGIVVLAISTATPGLDADPKPGSTDYVAVCGPAGGTAGQATRIATATSGVFVTGINPGNIASTIISLVSGAIGAIQNIKLVPSASVVPFITSISPAAGYGPLAGDTEHTLKFEVRFHGIPCRPEAQVVGGSIDVVVDGSVVAAKRVQITVPACVPKGFVYAVKFICGTQPECDCQCGPVRPGRYATEINLLNPGSKEVNVLKRFVPVVLAGAPAGREPRATGPRAEDKIVLPPHSATMDDCCRINELLFGAPGASLSALTIGFVEITTDTDIVVTAVYTASGLDAAGVSIDVQQVTAHRA